MVFHSGPHPEGTTPMHKEHSNAFDPKPLLDLIASIEADLYFNYFIIGKNFYIFLCKLNL